MVKTRLAASIGREQALSVYKRLSEQQLERLPGNFRLEIHYSPADAEAEMRAWLNTSAAFLPQQEGDLGARLTGAIRQAFKQGASRVYCIGGDCPALDQTHLHGADEALNAGNDVVFGPTLDGGYYLIGLKAPWPQLFESIPWSSDNTLKVSLDRAKQLGLKVHLLEPLYDVDKPADLHRAIREGLYCP